MRYAIFGGAGFIGTNLIERLIKTQTNDIFCFDNFSAGNGLARLIQTDLKISIGDMTNFQQVRDFLEVSRPDRIYHLVANSDISMGSVNPQMDVDRTLVSTLILINALSNLNIKELVFSSSSAVYGPKTFPIKEDSPLSPISTYGWMKLASEKALIAAEESGLIDKLLIARFPNVTGAYQTHGVIHDLIRKIRSGQSPLEVLGNGMQTKPYILASDLVSTLEELITLQESDVVTVNISPRDRCSVSEIVSEILQYTRMDLSVKYQGGEAGWVGDVPSYELDTTLLHQMIPNWTTYPSHEAIRRGISDMWDNG